ncbi:hypothetical protein GCM10009654_54110 [Streptomyces hebeiensis]|uniref:Lipoprotein n=1 Tax=Streptomyces hebeiensis TaxID=229486 RepID=A0ABN1V3P7_9ACTN
MRSTVGTTTAVTTAILCAAAVAGCAGGSGAGAGRAASEAPAGAATGSASAPASPSAPTGAGRSAAPAVEVGRVSVATTTLGPVLVNGKGRTLYLFEADGKNVSTCTGTCAKTWPPFIVTEEPKTGTGGVERRLLSTLTRGDGKRQVTYNGHPLYTYSGDSKAGQTNGQGHTDFDAHWYILTPDGAKNSTPQPNSGDYY